MSSLQTTEINKMVILSADSEHKQSCRPNDTTLSTCTSIQVKMFSAKYHYNGDSNAFRISSKISDNLTGTVRRNILKICKTVLSVLF